MIRSFVSLAIVLLAAFIASSNAHLVLTYPGWRGDNLITNGTAPTLNPNSIGIDYVNGTPTFPYGMQWMYPCGGMSQTKNRTLWPVNGGALGFQPGWFPGHGFATIYVNLGWAEPGELAPLNMSHSVVPPFGLVGPSNNMFDASVCLPRVTIPPSFGFKVGDNVTIQVIELAQHGAALYSCVDVTLAPPEKVAQVNSTNCKNDTWIGFQSVFTTLSLTSAAGPSIAQSPLSMLPTTLLLAIVSALFLI